MQSYVVFDIAQMIVMKMVQDGQEVGEVDQDSEVGFVRETLMTIVNNAKETQIPPGVGKCIH